MFINLDLVKWWDNDSSSVVRIPCDAAYCFLS